MTPKEKRQGRIHTPLPIHSISLHGWRIWWTRTISILHWSWRWTINRSRTKRSVGRIYAIWLEESSGPVWRQDFRSVTAHADWRSFRPTTQDGGMGQTTDHTTKTTPITRPWCERPSAKSVDLQKTERSHYLSKTSDRSEYVDHSGLQGPTDNSYS